MNTIHGIIHDLGNEETVISGCTTPGEVIIALQGLVEENHLLKSKLKKIKQAREEIASNLIGLDEWDYAEKVAKFYIEQDLRILDKLIEKEVG